MENKVQSKCEYPAKWHDNLSCQGQCHVKVKRVNSYGEFSV